MLVTLATLATAGTLPSRALTKEPPEEETSIHNDADKPPWMPTTNPTSKILSVNRTWSPGNPNQQLQRHSPGTPPFCQSQTQCPQPHIQPMPWTANSLGQGNPSFSRLRHFSVPGQSFVSFSSEKSPWIRRRPTPPAPDDDLKTPAISTPALTVLGSTPASRPTGSYWTKTLSQCPVRQHIIPPVPATHQQDQLRFNLGHLQIWKKTPPPGGRTHCCCPFSDHSSNIPKPAAASLCCTSASKPTIPPETLKSNSHTFHTASFSKNQQHSPFGDNGTQPTINATSQWLPK